VSVPTNGFGSQEPNTGSSYCGFATYVSTTPNYREMIQAGLTSPLMIGASYTISFYVSRANSGSQHLQVATDKIGALFSTVPFSLTSPSPIDNYAQFYTDSIITDSVNWVQLQGTFVADSSYQYIVLGNFFDDTHTDTMNMGQYHLKSYYYVDDVCVAISLEACSSSDAIPLVSSQKNFFVFPNPCSNWLKVIWNDEINNAEIEDLLGNVALGKKIRNEERNITVDISNIKDGVYIIKLRGRISYCQKILIVH
jgi:hypothetical protein